VLALGRSAPHAVPYIAVLKIVLAWCDRHNQIQRWIASLRSQ
jgi:hypothetical protein